MKLLKHLACLPRKLLLMIQGIGISGISLNHLDSVIVIFHIFNCNTA